MKTITPNRQVFSEKKMITPETEEKLRAALQSLNAPGCWRVALKEKGIAWLLPGNATTYPSVMSIAQVSRALRRSVQYGRRATQATSATRPYAEKAWKMLIHLARQPGRNSLHPLLTERGEIQNVLVLMISGDRGLAGAYNVNILRETLQAFKNFSQPVTYIAVGRKGRDLRRAVAPNFGRV